MHISGHEDKFPNGRIELWFRRQEKNCYPFEFLGAFLDAIALRMARFVLLLFSPGWHEPL
jgi:hypothetical protein